MAIATNKTTITTDVVIFFWFCQEIREKQIWKRKNHGTFFRSLSIIEEKRNKKIGDVRDNLDKNFISLKPSTVKIRRETRHGY